MPAKKLKPMTLPHFAAWLAKQPKGTEYKFGSCTTCALAQYLRETVPGFYAVDTKEYSTDVDGVLKTDHKLPRHFNEIAIQFPRTFGAAAKRARALLAKGA